MVATPGFWSQPLIPRPIFIAEAATALPFPPVSSAYVGQWNGGPGNVKEAEIEIWANLALDLSAARLYGGSLQSLVVADDTFTTEADDELATAVAHGLLTGDGPFRLTNVGGALAAGLAIDTDYWIRYVSANTFKFVLILEDSLAGTTVAFTDDGTGTHTLSDTTSTKRVHWNSFGLLGDEADGAIALGPQLSYRVSTKHSTKVVAYAVSATLSAETPETVSVAVMARR